jgi:hypothetical protein
MGLHGKQWISVGNSSFTAVARPQIAAWSSRFVELLYKLGPKQVATTRYGALPKRKRHSKFVVKVVATRPPPRPRAESANTKEENRARTACKPDSVTALADRR